MDRLKKELERFTHDPKKYHLDEQIIKTCVSRTTHADRNGINVDSLTNNNGENVYHIAVRHKDEQSIRILHTIFPVEKREQLLLMLTTEITAGARFLGSLGAKAKCYTPVSLCVALWRKPDGDDSVFNALMEGHDSVLKLQALTMTDEKCRSPICVVNDSRIKNQKKTEMSTILGATLYDARKHLRALKQTEDDAQQNRKSEKLIQKLKADNQSLNRDKKELAEENQVLNKKLKDVDHKLEINERRHAEAASERVDMQNLLSFLLAKSGIDSTQTQSRLSITSYDSAISINSNRDCQQYQPSSAKPGELTIQPTQTSE